MKVANNRKLVLKNGKVFEGIGFGSKNDKIAEIVFNTSLEIMESLMMIMNQKQSK